MFKPKFVNIFSKRYPIWYITDSAKVNPDGNKLVDGQIRHYDPQIRILDNGTMGDRDVLATLLEEISHGIESSLQLQCFDSRRGHHELTALCTGLADTFLRNGWWKEK